MSEVPLYGSVLGILKSGIRNQVPDFECRVPDFGYQVSSYEFRVAGCGPRPPFSGSLDRPYMARGQPEIHTHMIQDDKHKSTDILTLHTVEYEGFVAPKWGEVVTKLSAYEALILTA